VVEQVLKTLGGWEPLEDYINRTKCLVLRCVHEEDGVVAFLEHDPWISNLPTSVIDGKTYIPTQP
jgi:hypothetical protein